MVSLKNQKSQKSILKLLNRLDLSDKEYKSIYEYIESNFNGDIDSILAKYREDIGSKCPHCESKHIKKNGNDYIRKNGIITKKIQKYYCYDCHKTFSGRTGTIASHSKLSLKDIRSLVDCMRMGLSCNQTREETHFSVNTIYLWRHKLGDGNRIFQQSVKLNGKIQCDETFLKLSFKGNHSKDGFKMYRWSRHRGFSCLYKRTRGLSKKTQVSICCAVDSFGSVYSAPLCMGAADNTCFPKFFRGRYGSHPILVTDKSKALGLYAQKHNIPIVQITGGKHSVNGFHIQRVNAYHRNFKLFLESFRGVSTKYLPNYIAWFNGLINKKGNPREIREEFIRVALCQNVVTKRSKMGKRNPIPVLNKPDYHRIRESLSSWRANGFNIF